MDLHTQHTEFHNTEVKDWRSEVQILNDYIAKRTKSLSYVVKIPIHGRQTLGQIKAANRSIELISPDKQQIHSKPHSAGSENENSISTRSTQSWRWTLSNWIKQNGGRQLYLHPGKREDRDSSWTIPR